MQYNRISRILTLRKNEKNRINVESTYGPERDKQNKNVQSNPNRWVEKGMPFNVLYMNSINRRNQFTNNKVNQNKTKNVLS